MTRALPRVRVHVVLLDEGIEFLGIECAALARGSSEPRGAVADRDVEELEILVPIRGHTHLGMT